jgi:hypothetical protein
MLLCVNDGGWLPMLLSGLLSAQPRSAGGKPITSTTLSARSQDEVERELVDQIGGTLKRKLATEKRLRTHGVAQSSLVLDRLALEAHTELACRPASERGQPGRRRRGSQVGEVRHAG